MGKIINPNLRFLAEHLKHERRTELIKFYESGQISFDDFKAICEQEGIMSGVILRGSSRSFKTISGIDFIVLICSKFETSAVINIIRETYTSFKGTLYNDFNWRLPQYNIPSPFQNRQEVKSFKLYGNKINLIGADSESAQLGVGCDYLFVNEAIHVSKNVRDQAMQRCRKFWWMDMNPESPDHDVFTSTMSRKDVANLKTTYKDNQKILPQERIQIEGYQPVELSAIAKLYGSQDPDEAKRFMAIKRAMDYDTTKNPDKFDKESLKELERCKYNEKVGTVNKYKWMVYGLGEAMAPEGLIFPNVRWVREFPKAIEKVYWGMDFGYSESPSVLVKSGVIGKELYAEIRFYQPTPSSDVLIPLLQKHLPKENYICWADPSGEYGGRTMITDCRKAGLKIYAANSYAGSILDGIAILHKYNIHLVDCPEWRTEQQGYRKAEAKVGGIKVMTDIPIDDKNHAWDGLRLSAIMNRL
jgi:PBSX family phage terminase large subunit